MFLFAPPRTSTRSYCFIHFSLPLSLSPFVFFVFLFFLFFMNASASRSVAFCFRLAALICIIRLTRTLACSSVFSPSFTFHFYSLTLSIFSFDSLCSSNSYYLLRSPQTSPIPHRSIRSFRSLAVYENECVQI